MIQPNEIRVGNILNYLADEDGLLATTIDWQDIKYCTDDPQDFNRHHFPIPLTEEILLKCGFKSDGLFYEFRPVGYVFKSDFTYLWIYDVELKACICVKCEYLHRLQNLCFEFTGSELEVNL